MFASRAYYNTETLNVSVIFPTLLIDIAVSKGANRNQILRASGIGDLTLSVSSVKISMEQYLKVIEACINSVPNEGLSLDFGRLFDGTMTGELLPLMMSCDSFEDAIRRSVDFAYSFNISVEKTKDEFIISSGSASRLPASSYQFVAEAFAYHWLNMLRTLCRNEARIKRLAFVHAEPRYAQRIVEELSDVVEYNCVRNEVVFERAMCEVPLPTANPATKALLLRRFEQTMEQIVDSVALPARVADIISAWQDGTPTAQQVAAALNIPLSSLSKKLHNYGTNFQKILDEIRCDLALSYLRETDATVSEVAEKLGFSDPSNFRRAFKNWTGTTPSDYKQELLQSTS